MEVLVQALMIAILTASNIGVEAEVKEPEPPKIERTKTTEKEVKETKKKKNVKKVKKQKKPSPKKEQPPSYSYSPVNVCNPYTNIATYMDYRANGEHTAQWQYQINAITLENGLRSTNGFIHVALAKPYGDLGTTLLITFENGIQLPVIMVEWKGNTDCTHPDGSMLEFVVDSNYVDITAYQQRIVSMAYIH